MIASPLYWLSAFFPMLSGIFNNFAIVLNNSREPVANLELIEKFKVSALCGSDFADLDKPIAVPHLSLLEARTLKPGRNKRYFL